MLFETKNLQISTKIMLGHAVILVCLLFLTSFMTVAGVCYTYFHQSERELHISVERVLKRAEERGTQLTVFGKEGEALPNFLIGVHRDKGLVPGVVLQVQDMSTGQMIYGSLGSSTDQWRASMAEPPALLSWFFSSFFPDSTMKLVSIDNFTIGCVESTLEQDGKKFQLRFFRVITAETQFLQHLAYALAFINGFLILLSLLAVYWVTRRTLEPIRTITKAAQEIEVSDLSQRLKLPPVRDELTALMETFNHMLDRLEFGFEQQRRFVSDASHELRTPVTVISGYSEMLARWGRDDPETLDEGIAAIRSEAEDMQSLIEELLFLARADQKRQVMHMETCTMPEIIADVAKKSKMVAKEHTVTLTANEDGTAFLDVVLFKQMLRVFIENSLKYTPPGGHITLSSVRQGRNLCVTVADDGIGIAPEDQEKVFDRFYRVDSSRTKSEGGVGGSGLGLSIASWIAEEHRIKISLSSELGKGTTISLLVPLLD